MVYLHPSPPKKKLVACMSAKSPFLLKKLAKLPVHRQHFENMIIHRIHQFDVTSTVLNYETLRSSNWREIRPQNGARLSYAVCKLPLHYFWHFVSLYASLSRIWNGRTRSQAGETKWHLMYATGHQSGQVKYSDLNNGNRIRRDIPVLLHLLCCLCA